jgi:hypothetical protein
MERIVSIPLFQYLIGDVCQVEAFVLVKLHSAIVFFLFFLSESAQKTPKTAVFPNYLGYISCKYTNFSRRKSIYGKK